MIVITHNIFSSIYNYYWQNRQQYLNSSTLLVVIMKEEILQQPDVNDILLQVMRGNNYNELIAKNLKKKHPYTLKKLQQLEKTGFILSKKEPYKNKRIYKVQKELQSYENFVKLAKVNLDLRTYQEFVLTDYFFECWLKHGRRLVSEVFGYLQKVMKTISEEELRLIFVILILSPTASKMVFEKYRNKTRWKSSTLTVHELHPHFPNLTGDSHKLIPKEIVREGINIILEDFEKKHITLEDLKKRLRSYADKEMAYPEKNKLNWTIVSQLGIKHISDYTEILMCALVVDYIQYRETRFLVDNFFNPERIVEAYQKGDRSLRQFFDEMKVYVDKLNKKVIEYP